MSAQGLPVSSLIDVTVNLEPAAAQFPSVTSAMFIGTSDVIDVHTRYMTFANLAAVAATFGTEAPEYAAAALFFGQSPSPEQLFIGRWAESATHALLYCGDLTSEEQAIGNWTAITTGTFKINVDGGGVAAVTGCDFSGATTLNGVATLINAQLATADLGATVSWNGSQFVFQSTSTGATSTLSALTADGAGEDISAQLMGTADTLSLLVQGIAAESALTALTLLEDMVQFYMIMYPYALVDDDVLAIAAYVEGDATPHIFALTVTEAGAIDPAATSDIGYQLRALGYKRTCYQYSSLTAWAIASLLGLAATTNFEAANSTKALMYKSEPGVNPEVLTGTAQGALNAKNYNYYAIFNNGIPIIVNGEMAATDFYFDDIQGADWMVAQVQTDLFNLLYQTPTKIPQTDAGVHLLTTTIESSLSVGLLNGQIGPGVWEFDGIGAISRGDYLEKGYYVFAPSIASQSSGARLARQSPLITCLVIFAGAVQTVAILINVQR